MLRDPGAGMEQLDGIVAELVEAGRIARMATASRELPNPAYSARLRADLLRSMPHLVTLAGAAPKPPARPRDGIEVVERRSPARPLSNERRRWADAEAGAPAAVTRPADDDKAASRPRSGRRWSALRAAAAPPAPGVRSAIAAADAAGVAAEAGHTAMLRPRVHWQMPARAMPARWVAVGLAASLLIASLMYGTTFFFPSRPTATARLASNATLVRGGATSSLTAGEELREGDEVRVAAGGQATLDMAGSFVRMAPGSDVRLESLNPDHVVIDQLGGRAYHRVSVDDRGDYTVVTASVKWTATGTAFDLDRYATSGNGEAVRGLALLDVLDLAGPALHAAVSQGQSAVVQLSGGQPQGRPEVGAISSLVLADAWLVENARLDYLAGLDLGELAADVRPTPEPTRTEPPTPEPTAELTAAPTPKPTPKPTPRPTAAGPANLGALKVVHNGDGSYTFSWPKYTAAGFSFYKLVHGPAGSSPNYPTSDYWACNEQRWETSWTGFIPGGDYSVRLQVVDDSGSKPVIRAQTALVHLVVSGSPPTLPPAQSLGPIGVHDNGDGTMTLSWAPYTGGWGFSAYKVVYGPAGSSPSYLTGSGYFAAVGPGATSVKLTIGADCFDPGEYAVRVQAIGSFGGDTVVFGQTSVLDLTVPSA